MAASSKSAVVHARLDPRTQEMLADLRRRRGARDSAIIREAIQALHGGEQPPTTPKIVGLGEFTAPAKDLATNRAHLKGFGRK